MFGALVLLWGSTCIGCKGVFGSDEEEATASVSADMPATPPSAPAVASTAVANTASANTASANTACPAGRWRYDYSDQALEVMMKNTVAGKVIKEEGEFVCSIDAGQQGSIVCSSQGKPVVNVVETKQAGIPMRVSVEIDGTATTKFTLVDAQRMKVVSSDTSQLNIKASVELAGKAVPFPTDKLLGIFGDPESVLMYKCEQGALAIKPELAGIQTDWQQFTPAK